MKIKEQFQKYVIIAILVASVLISLLLAFHIYRQYAVLARGISGVGLAILLFYFAKHSGLDAPLSELYMDKDKIKYIVSALIIPLLSYFASLQIYELYLFLMRR
jgi:hypothetical protein